MIRWLAVALLWLASSASFADEFVLKPGKVLFLGDSNTYAGHFVAYLDAYLATRFPDQQYELINLGLPSETCTGLSEKDHPWPRPDVHERAQRALDRIKPNYVVVCYGMNDGIYSPFAEDRFEKYKQGIQSLLEKIRKAGAQPILMTPCPFDPLPLAGKTQPKEAGDFSYRKPYDGYDEVLTKYSDWLVTLRSKELPVADPHSAIVKFLGDVRKTQPKYFISGDGIHPNETGHALVAFTLLEALRAPKDLGSIDIPAGKESAKASLKITMPVHQAWHEHLLKSWALPRDWNRWTVNATVPAGERRLLVASGEPIAAYTSEELAKGVRIDPLQVFQLRAQSAGVLEIAVARQRLLRDAWIQEVGHKRPDTPKGQPLDKVETTLQDFDRQLKRLSQPTMIEVGIRPERK